MNKIVKFKTETKLPIEVIRDILNKRFSHIPKVYEMDKNEIKVEFYSDEGALKGYLCLIGYYGMDGLHGEDPKKEVYDLSLDGVHGIYDALDKINAIRYVNINM